MADSVMVIGGGITGIQAALDLANAGCKVVLVDKEAAIGGKMAALDKNFPTLDCSICIEAPKMSEVVKHANIEVLTLSEVTKVEGKAGDFNVTVHQKARYVTDECTRCDDCVPVCPQAVPNAFDVGMGTRKAIYTPFEQAEPGDYAIDIELCLNEPPNYLPCNRCTNACGPKCIDFGMVPQDLTRNVGAIIVSPGFELLNPKVMPELAYGQHSDVLTSMEFERLLQSSGPSGGEIIKPSNMKHPHSLVFALCIGSRDQRFCSYCSRICCMYSIKESVQSVDHGIKDVTILYMDIRAYGKGFDEFFNRSKSEGVKYVRGRLAKVTPNGENLILRFEDTDTGIIREMPADMLVLAPAVIPNPDLAKLAGVLGLELGEDGFIKPTEYGGDMIATNRPGIYVAGCATGPKDIPDSVTEAGAAVAYALQHVTQKTWPPKLDVQPIDLSGQPKVGVFMCHCGSNIAGTVNVKEVVKYVSKLPFVEHVEDIRFACAGNALNQITETIKSKKLTRAVVGACSPKTHGVTFQQACAEAGLNPYLFEMANVRNQDSWVHKKEPEAATQKAKDLVKMAVSKALHLQPLTTAEYPVTQRALVVGGGVAGMSAAASLARQGFETHLVERAPELGGILRHLEELAPSGLNSKEIIARKVGELKDSGVHVHLSSEVDNISGFVGNFNAHLTSGENLDVGAVVLATGADVYEAHEFGYGTQGNVLTSFDLESKISSIRGDRVTILSCVGSRTEEKGCSRFCCETMIRQALQLREQGKKVRVLYRDIRTFSRNAEELYETACREGVQFLQLAQDASTVESITFQNGFVIAHDELIGHQVAVPTDLLILNVGLQPHKDGVKVADLLKVSRDLEGFLLESHPKLGPVEAAVSGVFLAGTSQGPKDVRESVAQGLATAAKAAGILSRRVIEREPVSAMLNEEKCTYCMRCVPVCSYSALQGELKKSIEFYRAMCMGCGACAVECNVGAITMPGFTDEQIFAQIDAALESNAEEKVLVFACNWCSYAGADQAGIAKIQYPPSGRIVKTMCSARVSQNFIMQAFLRGAAAVLVTGCHIGDCHYINANHQTQKRFERWVKTLQARGVDPRRLQLCWVSAAEGKIFAAKIKEMDELIKQLPREEISSTPKKLAAFMRRAS